MRPCETEQLTLKPFASEYRVCIVGEDRVVREASLGGGGRFESLPTVTLFLPADAHCPVGTSLTVNLLPGVRRVDGDQHYEESQHVKSPRMAESRFAFECIVLATGSLDGEHPNGLVVVARVLCSHQRWPRGCAIT